MNNIYIDSFLSIIGKPKDELLMTKLIAYILNPANTTIEIIEKILIAAKSDKDTVDFVKLLHEKENNFWDIKSENGFDMDGTADIVMKATKFWIVIENKINAQETGNQSDRYAEIATKQNIPIKYIHLKPDYNYHKLQNEKFIEFNYSQLLEILKEIKFTNLAKPESFIYITDMINHIQHYLIGEYSNNWDNVKNKNKLKKSNHISDKLIDALKKAFGITNSLNNEYTVYFYERFNCFQIWKNSWNNLNDIKDRKGIHYEICFKNLDLYELNYISKKCVEVNFVIHNETKKGYKIPFEYLKRETYLYDRTYDLDTEENINKSVQEIANKTKELSEQYDSMIDNIVNTVKRI